MDDRAIIKQNHVLKIQTENISRGRTVFLNPTIDFLPSEFQADLLVVDGHDNYVHAVRNRSLLAKDSDSIAQASEILKARNNWNFVLNLIGEPESVATPASSVPLDMDGIYLRLIQARRLNWKDDTTEAAFMLCWSACEALIRLILIKENEYEINRPVTSEYLVSVLHSLYIFSNADIKLLRNMVDFNNMLSNGFKPIGFSKDDTDKLILMSDALINFYEQEQCQLDEQTITLFADLIEAGE